MSELQDLPKPASETLRSFVAEEELRNLYAFLYSRRADPPTMVEIRAHATARIGESHAQTDRRVRSLRKWFDLPAVRCSGHTFVYELRSWKSSSVAQTIPSKARGEVLNSQRCAQCGKTPTDDQIRLEVDHKIPQSWGGTNEIGNLQALCTQCNHDKQAFYSSMDPYENEIRAATIHEEPHRRIGELLKAFQQAGVEAPSQVIATVASMRQYQEDWQKRTRELRNLGWDYTTRKRKENGRIVTYYRLTIYQDWPAGNIAAEIKRREQAKKNRKQNTDRY